MFRSNISFLALLLTTLGGTDRAAAVPPRVGERHPDFTLPSIADGTPAALADFRGKKVLLIQFASW